MNPGQFTNVAFNAYNNASNGLVGVSLGNNNCADANQSFANPDFNMNSPTGYLANHQLRWAPIGGDDSDRDSSTPGNVVYSRQGGQSQLPAPFTFPPVNVPPPTTAPSSGGARWMACFPPPSMLPWWCVPAERHSVSTDDAESYCSSATTPGLTPSATAVICEDMTTVAVDDYGAVDRISLAADSATPTDLEQTVCSTADAPIDDLAQKLVLNDGRPQNHSDNNSGSSFNAPTSFQSLSPSSKGRQAVFSKGYTLRTAPSAVRHRLKSQLEYYFSGENLTVDDFLKSQMSKEGFVPIETVAGFNKVRSLTEDLDLVVSVLKESTLVQIDQKGEKVRPICKRCTVFLREVPEGTTATELESLFATVASLNLLSCEPAHNNSWYLTFESEDDAQRAFVHLQTLAFFKGKPLLARIKNMPIPRVDDFEAQQAASFIMPTLPTTSESTAMATAKSSPPSLSTDGSDVTSSPPVAHKPPMDPVGAATAIPGAYSARQGAASTAFSLPPPPPGFVWCMAPPPPPPPAGPNRQTAPLLAPSVLAPQASVSYIDINQILALNALQTTPSAFRPGFQLFMPAAPPQPAMNGGNFVDKSKNRRGGPAAAGMMPFNKFNGAPFFGSAGARLRFPTGSSGNGDKRLQPPPTNAVDQFYSSLNALTAAAAAVPVMHPVFADPMMQQRQSLAAMGLRPPFGNGMQAAPSLYAGFTAVQQAPRHPGTHSVFQHCNFVGATASGTQAHHPNRPFAAVGPNCGGGRQYSGRSSSSTSDYWSAKDTPKHHRKPNPMTTTVGAYSDKKATSKMASSAVAAIPKDIISKTAADLKQQGTSLSNENPEFDLHSTSFPPLSEVNVSQPNAKISYADKAKSAVGAASKPVVSMATTSGDSLTDSAAKSPSSNFAEDHASNASDTATVLSVPVATADTQHTRDGYRKTRPRSSARHSDRTFRPSVPYSAQNYRANVQPAVTS